MTFLPLSPIFPPMEMAPCPSLPSPPENASSAECERPWESPSRQAKSLRKRGSPERIVLFCSTITTCTHGLNRNIFEVGMMCRNIFAVLRNRFFASPPGPRPLSDFPADGVPDCWTLPPPPVFQTRWEAPAPPHWNAATVLSVHLRFRSWT